MSLGELYHKQPLFATTTRKKKKDTSTKVFLKDRSGRETREEKMISYTKKIK